MPFTGSHPAAVLPFVRSAMPASALVIGSMVPDLPFYAPTPYSAELSHQFVGTVTVDPLAGLALFALWHVLIAPAVVAYAPAALLRRLPATVPAALGAYVRPVRRLLWTLLALVVGAWTHVAWDAFTHASGWAVHHLRWLSGRTGPLPTYEWAQYASGLAGAVLILGWSVRWFRTQPVVGDRPARSPLRSRRTDALTYAVIAVAVALGAGCGLWHGWHQPDRVRSMLYFAATRGIDGGLAVVLGLALMVRATAGRSVPDGEPPR